MTRYFGGAFFNLSLVTGNRTLLSSFGIDRFASFDSLLSHRGCRSSPASPSPSRFPVYHSRRIRCILVHFLCDFPFVYFHVSFNRTSSVRNAFPRVYLYSASTCARLLIGPNPLFRFDPFKKGIHCTIVQINKKNPSSPVRYGNRHKPFVRDSLLQ